jgi:hypothetical protein
MKDKGKRPPSNVIKLIKLSPPRPSSATIVEGLELVKVFLTIRSKLSRQEVLAYARQIAADDANTVE